MELKKSFKTFIGTFKKFDNNSLKVLLYDLLFYVSIIGVLSLLYLGLKVSSASLQGYDLSKITSFPQEQLEQILAQLKLFILVILLSLIILYLLGIFFFSLFKSLAWFNIGNKKLNWKKILRIFGFNLWFIPIYSVILGVVVAVLIMMTLIFSPLPSPVDAIAKVLFVIAVLTPTAEYLIFLLYSLLFNMTKERSMAAMRRIFSKKLTIKRFYWHLLILSLIFNTVSYALQLVPASFAKFNAFTTFIFVVLFLFFMEYYFLEILRE